MTSPHHLSPTQQIGYAAEESVAQYLRRCGYTIYQLNYWCPEGEIDIVAQDDSVIVFVEVKQRKNDDYGHPVEAVTRAKLERIERAAHHFFQTHPSSLPFRYDIVTLLGDTLEHFINVTME